MRSQPIERYPDIRAELPIQGILPERTIGASGLPYLVGGAIFVLVVGLPGPVIFHCLGSGNVAESMEVFFHGLRPSTLRQPSASLIMFNRSWR